MKRHNMLLSAGLGAFLFTACGDDDGHDHEHGSEQDGSVDAATMDASTGNDASTDAATAMDAATGNDASADAGDAGDAGDASSEPTYEPPAPLAIELSAGGPDQLQSAVAGPDGSFYAAGFRAETPAGARSVIVVKLTAGGLDEDFGDEGVAVTPLEFRGGNDEIDIAVQPSGKLLVSATVANASNDMDRDVAIIRLDDDGTVDDTFGGANDGVRVIDLNSAVDSAAMPGMLTGFDGARSIAVADDGAIYLHAVQRGAGDAAAGGPRQDTDFVVVKLSADGVPDATFANDAGKFLLDFEESPATPRGIYMLEDGTILGTGYANTPAVGSTQVVLYKLTSVGVIVDEFATGGIFNEAVLAVQTEAYGAAIHGDHIITGGYGREGGERNEWVALKFDSETGERDEGFGGADKGAVIIDPSGGTLGNNCRGAYALPGGKTLLIGSTGPGNMPEQDAAFAVLDGDGLLDEAYGDAVFTYPFREQGADQFWGAAVSGDNLLLVGYSGAGMTQSDELNDDAYVVILPLE